MGQKLKLDFTGVESFQRASEGIHAVKIATAEVKKSQGGNDMIVVAFEVTKGTDKGARVYENYVLTDTSLWKLKGLLQAIGMKADGKIQLDVDKLIGKVCQINVQHEEYDGKLRARVESVMKFAAEADDDDDEDLDDEADEVEEEEEEAPAKKTSKKTAKKEEPEDSEDDDDWDDDEEEEEEPEEKPAKKGKAAKKEEKKPAKKSKKDEEPEDDDDWDDDEDWDEE